MKFFLLFVILAAGVSRPEPSRRCFSSPVIEEKIAEVTAQLENEKLAVMFANCFPNTLDTTVEYSEDDAGNPDTFVITGDIHAMWLRDSGAQVWPYVRFCAQDPSLAKMIKGVIRRQLRSIILDPYANAFNKGLTPGQWQSDYTRMIPGLHERKWEIDSHCYPIRLAYQYWKVTSDESVFDALWLESVRTTLVTFREQQRKNDRGP